MRIGVGNPLQLQKRAASVQVFHNLLAAGVDFHSGILAGLRREVTPVIHRRENLQAVALANLKVLHAMARRSVHTAAASVQSHMVAKDNHRIPVVKRVLANNALQLLALKLGQHAVISNTHILRHLRQQLLGQHQFVLVQLHHGIGVIRVDTNSQVGGNSPRRGCPNQKADVVAQQPFAVRHCKFNVD